MKIELRDLKRYGVTLNWNIIRLGFDGFQYMPGQFSVHDIEEYAGQCLLKGDDRIAIASLSSASHLDEYEIDEAFDKLTDKSTIEKDKIKWVAVYLLKTLDSLDNTNYVEGLLEIGDVWAMFEFPKYSPHIFQGKNNRISPSEYYTSKNYVTLLKANRRWAEKIILELEAT